jgi:hypothetical protein
MLIRIILCTVMALAGSARAISRDGNSTLTVAIVPAEAADAGARWRVNDGPEAYVSDWKMPGATLQDPKLTDGDHSIEFNAVPGWQRPASQVIFIRPGKPHAAEGEYRK